MPLGQSPKAVARSSTSTVEAPPCCRRKPPPCRCPAAAAGRRAVANRGPSRSRGSSPFWCALRRAVDPVSRPEHWSTSSTLPVASNWGRQLGARAAAAAVREPWAGAGWLPGCSRLTWGRREGYPSVRRAKEKGSRSPSSPDQGRPGMQPSMGGLVQSTVRFSGSKPMQMIWGGTAPVLELAPGFGGGGRLAAFLQRQSINMQLPARNLAWDRLILIGRAKWGDGNIAWTEPCR